MSKYLVLAIVGYWFAYQTAYMLRPVVMDLTVIWSTLAIGFGYTLTLVLCLDRRSELPRAITYLLLLAIMGGVLAGIILHLDFFPSFAAFWAVIGVLFTWIRLRKRVEV